MAGRIKQTFPGEKRVKMKEMRSLKEIEIILKYVRTEKNRIFSFKTSKRDKIFWEFFSLGSKTPIMANYYS